MMHSKPDEINTAFARKAIQLLNNIIDTINDAIWEHKLDYKTHAASIQILANGIFAEIRYDARISDVMSEDNFKHEKPRVFNTIPDNYLIPTSQFTNILKGLNHFVAQDSTTKAVRELISPLIKQADTHYAAYQSNQINSATFFDVTAKPEVCYVVYAKCEGDPIALFKEDISHILYGTPFDTEQEAKEFLENATVKGTPTIGKFDISATMVQDLIDNNHVDELAKHLVELYGEAVNFNHTSASNRS